MAVPGRGLRLGTLALLGLTAVAILVQIDRLREIAMSPYPVVATVPYAPASTLGGGLETRSLSAVPLPRSETFERGDTLERVLARHGLDRQEAWTLSRELAARFELRTLIKAGHQYVVAVDRDERTVELNWRLEDRGRVVLARSGSAWTSRFEEFERVVRRRQVEATLDGALETAILDAGGPSTLALAMSDVLQWDLDFNRDLRKGDRFAVSYDELWIDGERQGVDLIHALSYENRGRRLEAFRFGDDGGYYDAAGRPLRKQFLRSPLPYSRVTSRFSHRRFHPVLKTYRPHYGVDYGAPVGTPVRVTANGVVRFVGWDKGGGRTVKVRHANGFETAYLHLSKFAKGVRSGVRVRQGEIVGHVGASGLATGPHLDYRVKRNGRYLDPLSLHADNPPVEPLAPELLVAFQRHRSRALEDLGVADLGPDRPAPSSVRTASSGSTGPAESSLSADR